VNTGYQVYRPAGGASMGPVAVHGFLAVLGCTDSTDMCHL